MRKKHIEELVKSMKKVEEGFAEVSSILSAIQSDSEETATETPKKEGAKKSAKKAEEPAEETENADSDKKAELDGMKYNDLKKYGSKLGVNVRGTREEITSRILKALADGADTADDSEEVADNSKVTPITKNRKSAKKPVKKTEEPAEDEAEDDSEDDGIEEKYLQSARELMEEYDLPELCEALAEVGVKLSARDKKKEDVVMQKVAEALAKGLLDTEEDEEDAEDDSDAEETEEEALSPDSYFENYDPEGINDPSSMSKKRKKAVEALVAEIIDKIEEGDLDDDTMESELEDICTDEDIDLLGDDYSSDDLTAFYIEMKKRFIDDDGDSVEQGEPYELAGENYCCGHELKYDKKSKKYTCAVCGEEYEAD